MSKKWTLFHLQDKKCLIANDLPILHIKNFEIVSILNSWTWKKLDMEIPYRTCL